jgi:TPR repeat protein
LGTAARWFQRAAEQGHATAAHNIGVFLAKGMGVERDVAKATEWFKLAADAGITAAQVQLGKL